MTSHCGLSRGSERVRAPAHGCAQNERQLLQAWVVPFGIGFAGRRRELLDGGFGRQSPLEIFLVDTMKCGGVGEVVEIDPGGDDLIKIQVSLLTSLAG